VSTAIQTQAEGPTEHANVGIVVIHPIKGKFRLQMFVPLLYQRVGKAVCLRHLHDPPIPIEEERLGMEVLRKELHTKFDDPQLPPVAAQCPGNVRPHRIGLCACQAMP
jgi:hypothetical protein